MFLTVNSLQEFIKFKMLICDFGADLVEIVFFIFANILLLQSALLVDVPKRQ